MVAKIWPSLATSAFLAKLLIEFFPIFEWPSRFNRIHQAVNFVDIIQLLEVFNMKLNRVAKTQPFSRHGSSNMAAKVIFPTFTGFLTPNKKQSEPKNLNFSYLSDEPPPIHQIKRKKIKPNLIVFTEGGLKISLSTKIPNLVLPISPLVPPGRVPKICDIVHFNEYFEAPSSDFRFRTV